MSLRTRAGALAALTTMAVGLQAVPASPAPHAADAPTRANAPTSVVATWQHEAATFTPGLTVRAVTESRSRRGQSLAEVHAGADMVVTSYTLFRLEADEYVALDWGGLVLDEAQMVKNHLGKTHQGVRRLDVPFRLALTGGRTYTFFVGSQQGCASDIGISMLDSGGNLVASSEGVFLPEYDYAARLVFRAPRTGTFYATVGAGDDCQVLYRFRMR